MWTWHLLSWPTIHRRRLLLRSRRRFPAIIRRNRGQGAGHRPADPGNRRPRLQGACEKSPSAPMRPCIRMVKMLHEFELMVAAGMPPMFTIQAATIKRRPRCCQGQGFGHAGKAGKIAVWVRARNPIEDISRDKRKSAFS